MSEEGVGQKIFMLGIGGSGMRGLALLLESEGHQILGTDKDFEMISSLRQMDDYYLVKEDEAKKMLTESDMMIYTDAATREHPLRKFTWENRILAMPFNRALGEMTRRRKTIAVTGAHGKSSTTAMLAHVMVEAGLDPMCLVGASIPAWDGLNARVGKGEHFVVEADEYREHFLSFSPAHAIVTSIDFDHPDYFDDLSDVLKAYGDFLKLLPDDGVVATTKKMFDTFPNIGWPTNTVAVEEEDVAKLEVPLPGAHMRTNAGLVIALLEKLGVKADDSRNHLKTFAGLSRRFEKLGRYKNLEVISDYGHHPKEIEVTMKAAREKFVKEKILVLFEAHTLERLKEFKSDFVNSLNDSNGLMVMPVFAPPGRQSVEVDEGEIEDNLNDFLAKIEKEIVMVQRVYDYGELPESLDRVAKDFDVALAFSAGVLDSELRKLLG